MVEQGPRDMPSTQKQTNIMPLSEERRRFQRVRVNLLGRYMLADRREFPCQITDMSPGGYWPHTSVALATTPLLLKKIFMWLGQASHSGSAWAA